jgi:WD40 repeat protein
MCKGYEPISPRIIDVEPWKRAFAFEHEEQRWQKNQSLLRYRSAQVHGATVDALKVHETRNGSRFAISGARDRSIILWDIKNVVNNESDKSKWHKVVPAAHTGWVWTVCVGNDDKSVFSCGFDSMLKQWEIVDGTLKASLIK